MSRAAVEADSDTWRDRALIPTLVMIGLVMAILSSLGAPLINSISRADHVSLSTGQWALTATLLAGAVASPVMGQLGDGRHRKKVILGALAIVVVGSVIAATITNFTALIVGRSLQGLGMGLIPVAMVVARRELSARKSATVIGLLSITSAAGIGLGYPITGLIAQAFDYRIAFWFGAVVVLSVMAVAAVVLPPDAKQGTSHLDVLGSLLFAVVLVPLLIVISEGGQWGWVAPRTVGLLVLAVVALLCWVRHELRTEYPLVVLSHLRSRPVWVANLVALIVGMTMYLFVPVIVEFVEIPRSEGYGFGSSIAVAGLCLLPLSVGTVLASPIVVWLRARVGDKYTILVGQIPIIVGMLFFALRHAALWEAFVTTGLGGLGVGITYACMPAFIIAAVPSTHTGSAMALYQVVRSVGLSSGSAVSASILAAYTSAHHDLPRVQGYSTVLFVAAALCVCVAAVSLLMPAAHSRGPMTDKEAVEEAVDTVETATLA